jgi:hypothetical protein
VPIDTTRPGSPGWWLERMLKRLEQNQERYELLEEYFEGCPPVPQLRTKAVKEAYRRLMSLARTNFAELVVEAVRERMSVNGFRTGAQSDELGDAEAWRIWQASGLDAASAIVHRTQLALGDAYVMVGGVDPDLEAPIITPEDPREIAVLTDPTRPRKPIAALKAFQDELTGLDRVYLFVQGFVLRASRARGLDEKTFGYDVAGFEWSDTPQRLPGGVIPVVRFANQPDMRGNSKGEFERHLPILNRINYSILSRLEIATLQAFRQRAIKGVPTHDNAGNEIDYDDLFNADPGAMWQLPAAGEVWESGQVDLGPIRDAIRHDVQDLAAVTRTPLFYLTPDANNGSAEGASLAREGLVFKTADRLATTGEAWEDVLSLAFTVLGDQERAQRRDMEIIWSSPERFTLSERYDAATKAQSAGVPWRTIMSSILQFTPQEIDRMEAERAADALLVQTLSPPAPAAQPPAQQPPPPSNGAPAG